MANKKSGFLDEFRLTPLTRFLHLLSVDRREVIYIYVYAIFNGIVYLSIPLGIQAIINFIQGGQVTMSWIILVIVVILGTLFAGIIQIMQVAINERIQQKIFTRSAFEFSYRIPRVKMETLGNRYAPELVNRFFDTLTIQKGLPKILIDFSTATLEILFGLVLLSFYSAYFVIFSISFIILTFLVFRLTGPVGLRASLRESKHKYEVVHWLEELARAMPTFKLSGIPALTMNKTDGLVTEYLKSRNRHFRVLMTQFISMVGLKVFMTAGLLILGGILVINQQMNLGQFVGAEIIIVLLINSIDKLFRGIEIMYDVVTATEKISEVTDLELEQGGGMDIKSDDGNGGLALTAEKLDYQSQVTGIPILKNIDLSIESGEKVCLSGYSGSGKSSLLFILSGIYQNFTGNLLFNGIPSSNIDIHKLRAEIGDNFSQQDVFNGTITENITMGKVNASDKNFREAVEFSGLTSMIKELPDGYETQIGAKGIGLAKSYVKRIILARSLVSNPMLMAVEDNFFNFEKKEKERIVNYLVAPERPWTLIMVSNDLTVAEACDKVVFMDNGAIKACDTAKELKKAPWFNEIVF